MGYHKQAIAEITSFRGNVTHSWLTHALGLRSLLLCSMPAQGVLSAWRHGVSAALAAKNAASHLKLAQQCWAATYCGRERGGPLVRTNAGGNDPVDTPTKRP